MVAKDLTQEEKIVAAINTVRINPKSAVPLLRARLARFDGKKLRAKKKGEPNIMTAEGAQAVEDCIEYLSAVLPLPPLQLKPELSKAAKDHLDDIGPHGLASHVGSDGSSMQVSAMGLHNSL